MSNPPHSNDARQKYPGSWSQFCDWFANDASCREYLERLRWPVGFVCPACARQGDAYRATRHRLLCVHCNAQTTVTRGTVFDKTRTPLKHWFTAAWYISEQNHGMTAFQLQRELELGSYQTAWTMLHRLRSAMATQPEEEKLNGEIEVDAVYIGGASPRVVPAGARGELLSDKHDDLKSPVLIAVEIQPPKRAYRIRMQCVSQTSKRTVLPFVSGAIASNANVRTRSGWVPAANTQAAAAFPQLRSGVAEGNSLPAVQAVAAELQNWLLSTFQGSVKPHQLDAYLNEFVFRYNHRKQSANELGAVQKNGELFYRLLRRALTTAPLSYATLARKTSQAGTAAERSTSKV